MMFLSVALLASSAPQASVPYAFKTYPLGMELEELRGSSLPAGDYGPRRFECSDRTSSRNLVVTPIEGKAGVVRCHAMETIGGSVGFADIALTPEIPAYVDFYFFRGKLFRIRVVADVGAADTIAESLRTKFGGPALTDRGEMQVKSGAKFPQTSMRWGTKAQSIIMVAPDLTTERMTVVYEDLVAAAAERAVELANSDPRSVM